MPRPTPADVRTVLLTSGKFYYELDAYRKSHDITDTAIVRLEQLYPVPRRTLARVLDDYPEVTDFRWVQEEPANQGAWTFLALALPELLPTTHRDQTGSRGARWQHPPPDPPASTKSNRQQLSPPPSHPPPCPQNQPQRSRRSRNTPMNPESFHDPTVTGTTEPQRALHVCRNRQLPHRASPTDTRTFCDRSVSKGAAESSRRCPSATTRGGAQAAKRSLTWWPSNSVNSH